jgi:hypothetical protein
MRGLCVEIPPVARAPSPYGPVEYVIWHDGTDGKVRYWSVDTSDGSHTELDTFDTPNATRQSVATDKTFLFVPGSTNYRVLQYAWDGTQFVPLYEEDSEGTAQNFPYGMNVIANHEDGNGKYFVCAGTGPLVQELCNVRYQSAAPFDFVGNPQTSFNDNWVECMDFHFKNGSSWDVGDALVMGPQDGANLTSYTFNGINGLLLTEADSLLADTGGISHSFGWDRFGGFITSDYAFGIGSATIGIWDIDLADMSIAFLGYGETKNDPVTDGNGAWAATPVLGGEYILTLEDNNNAIGGAFDWLRTYKRNGTGAGGAYPGTIDPSTLVDQHNLPAHAAGAGNGRDSYFRINPFTGTIYLLTGNANNGLVVLTVDSSGTINVIAEISGHYVSEDFGSSMTFVPVPFTNTVLPATYIVDDQGNPVMDQGNFVVPG